ncbi:MAG: DMT family transporter [Spirochaetia bacterium]|nr:DMT family transporter [Spirochaetia bacterium]
MDAIAAKPVNYLAGLGTSLLFGFSFLFTKNALDALGVYELLALRFALATLLMLALRGLGLVRLDFRGKDLKPLATVALLQPVLYFLLETWGLERASSSTGGIVLAGIPVAVAALGAIMLRERLKAAQVLTMLLSFAGVALVAWFRSRDAAAGSPAGVALLFGAMLCAAFFNIASRKASRTFAAAETTFFMMASGALVFGPLALAAGLADGSLATLGERLDARSVGSIVYLGGLSSVAAFFLVNFNLSKLRAPEAAVFANLTTVVSVVAGVAFRGEGLSWMDGAGALMIVAGVWGTNALGASPRKASGRE